MQHALCDECKALDFGKPVYDDEIPISHIFSRRFQASEDIRPTTCKLCAIRARLFAYDHLGNGKPETQRYVPFRRDSKEHAADASQASKALVDQLLHFKGEYRTSTFYIWALTHTFAPPVQPGSVAKGDPFNLIKADLPLAKAWYQHCQTKHLTTCGSRPNTAIPYLKVIDCSSGEVFQADRDCRYAALSYVWGATTGDSHVDKTGKYPKTIEDAMLVVISLGIRYLWVDRYCINQDDAQEKHSVICNMNYIYSGAEVTIIASSGPDPHHGLPGVSNTLRSGNCVTHFDQGYLIQSPYPEAELRTYAWESRGWTYQEMILSRRRLVFTESQMVFQCCKREFREAYALPSQVFHRPASPGSALLVPSEAQLGCTRATSGRLSPGFLFPEMITEQDTYLIYDRLNAYTTRKLSYPDDILNAFTGIFAAFKQDLKPYIHDFWGIPILDRDRYSNEPVRTFLFGLSWHVRDKEATQRPGNWPSWSWSSVTRSSITFGTGLMGDSAFTCQDKLWISLMRHDGQEGQIATYARNQHDYLEYHPFVKISTWSWWSGVLILDKERRATIRQPTSHGDDGTWSMHVRLDDRNHAPAANVVTTYIGASYSDYRENAFFFLVLVPAAEGRFRRIGLGTVDINYEAEGLRDDNMIVPAWLPSSGTRGRQNLWEFGTIVLE